MIWASHHGCPTCLSFPLLFFFHSLPSLTLSFSPSLLPSLSSYLLFSLPPIYLPFSPLSSLTPSLPSFLLSSLPLLVYPSSCYLRALLSSFLPSFLPSPNLPTLFSPFLPLFLLSLIFFLSFFLSVNWSTLIYLPMYYLNCIYVHWYLFFFIQKSLVKYP